MLQETVEYFLGDLHQFVVWLFELLKILTCLKGVLVFKDRVDLHLALKELLLLFL